MTEREKLGEECLCLAQKLTSRAWLAGLIMACRPEWPKDRCRDAAAVLLLEWIREKSRFAQTNECLDFVESKLAEYARDNGFDEPERPGYGSGDAESVRLFTPSSRSR